MGVKCSSCSTWAGVLQGEVLVLELVAVDGLATGSVPGSEVSTLKKYIY